MESIHIQVDERIKQEIDREAREKGVIPSVIIREVLEEHFGGREPWSDARQLAEQLGILGSAKGLPSDLSTNPEHMEGFGRD